MTELQGTELLQKTGELYELLTTMSMHLVKSNAVLLAVFAILLPIAFFIVMKSIRRS